MFHGIIFKISRIKSNSILIQTTNLNLNEKDNSKYVSTMNKCKILKFSDNFKALIKML